MQVILQSGGAGSRLYPFTINKPKCFLKLKGKTILDYQYENLKKYNLHKKLIIISNENHVHHFQRYFKNKKYKPKIVDGNAVRVDDVPHKFTFILEET